MRQQIDVLAAKQQVEIAAKMSAWVDAKKAASVKRKARKRVKDLGAFNRATELASERIEHGEWDDATPEELLGLFCVLHEKVYGVPAIDCADMWLPARTAVRRMLDAAPFMGNVQGFVRFMRFAWSGENRAEQRNRGTGKTRRRLTWRLLFGTRYILVDYMRESMAKVRPTQAEAAAAS